MGDSALLDSDTIVAIATPPGRGGIGVIRISGNLVSNIAQSLLGFSPKPRYAHFAEFKSNNDVLDHGLALFFPNPHSFTGENVLELQGHGGPVVLHQIIETIITLGARLARPGEFSERAFLNGKIDLVQAEAIADLIDSNSKQAAQSALKSLSGEFSKKIHHLTEDIITLRTFVEAAIDFPDEDIEFLADEKLQQKLDSVLAQFEKIITDAHQGRLLREGITIALAGKPNAGKSSLLNALSGQTSAIVTDIPGTTRDIVREHILLDGLAVHVLDTAGLRASQDPIEQEGIRRAETAISQADQILLVIDASETDQTDPYVLLPEFSHLWEQTKHITLVQNKIDQLEKTPVIHHINSMTIIGLSAKTGEGVDILQQHLKQCVGYEDRREDIFIARTRHLNALKKAQGFVKQGAQQLADRQAELFAEDLRLAQQFLGEITGEFTADDLLGEIFSTFCIGK